MLTPSLKYNLSKKIAQLVRVRSVFLFQVEENEFRKQSINNIYNGEFEKIREDTERKTSDFNQKMSQENVYIHEKYAENFQNQYQSLITGYNGSCDSINNNLRSFNEMVSKSCEDLLKEISNTTKYLNDRLEVQDGNFQKAKEEVSNHIMGLLNTYRKEVESLEQPVPLSIAKLTQDSKQNIQTIRDEHEKKMKELVLCQNKTNVCNEIHERIRILKKKQLQYKEETNKYLEKAMSLSRMHALFFEQIRKSVSSPRKPLQRSNEVIELQNEMQNQLKQMQEKIGLMKDEFSGKKASMEFKIQRIKGDQAVILEEMSNHYEPIIAELMSKGYNSGDELSELQKRLNNEISLEKERILKEQQEISQSIDVLQSQHFSRKALCKKEKKEISIQHKAIKKSNRDYCSKINLQNNNDLISLNEKKGKLIMENNQIIKQKQKTAQDQIQLKLNTKMGLSDQFASTKKFNIDSLKEIEIETEKEFLQKKETMNNEFSSVESTISNEYTNIVSQLSFEIQKINESKTNDYLRNKNLLEEDYSTRLSNFMGSFTNDSEIEEMKNKFKTEYENLSSKLNSITPPAITDNSQFTEMILKIEEKEKELSYLKITINDEKGLLLDNYKNLIEIENQRHSNSTSSISSGRARDQLIQVLRKQINDSIDSRNKQLHQLEENLKLKKNSHIIEMNKLNSYKQESYKERFINDLEKDLSNAYASKVSKQESLIKEKEFLIKSSQEGLANLNDSILKEKESLNSVKIRYMDQMKLENQSMMEKDAFIEQWLVSEKDRLNALYATSHDSIIKKANLEKKRISSIITEKNNLILSLQESFKKSIIALNEKFHDNIIMLEKESSSKFLEKQKNWKEMSIFYEESIETLNNKLLELKNKYENRGPRPCDLQEIQNLQAILQSRSSHLKGLVKDFKEFKMMLVDQEKVLNDRFGRNPNVGTISFT